MGLQRRTKADIELNLISITTNFTQKMVENGTVDLTEWDHSTRTVYKPIKYKINHLDIKQPLNDKFNSMYSYKVKI